MLSAIICWKGARCASRDPGGQHRTPQHQPHCYQENKPADADLGAATGVGGTSVRPITTKGITASAGMVAAGASVAGAMEVAVAGEAAVAGLVEVVATPTTSLFKGVNVRSSRGVRVLPA